MRYVVTFRKRFNEKGAPADDPSALLDTPDGVIEDASVVEIIQPPSIHASEDISEDDGFLSLGTETWVFDVAEGRDDEFKAAVAASEVALEMHEFDDEMVRKPYAQG
jgi:hypothetical protein